MKILVLGANGNLGTAFAAIAGEHQLIGWDRDEIDITDENLLRKKILALKPDAVINTVAYNDVDRCETDEAARELAETLNIKTVAALGEIALEADTILVHYSTDYVFAGDKPDGYDEAASPSPINAYGETKAAGERALISLSGRGLKWYLIRTSKLFGPVGTSPAAKPSFFEIMRRLAETHTEIKAVDEEKSCFTYTADLARATFDLLESGEAFGIYHLTNTGAATWYEAARYFFARLGREIELVPVTGEAFPRPAKRPKASMLLNTKRPALRSWQEAVDEYVDQL